MGLLSRTSRTPTPKPEVVPSGSFTVDRNGRVLTSTIRSGVAPETLTRIAKTVLETLHTSQENASQLQEFVVQFPQMILKARDLRGGAIIFLTPTKSAGKS